MTPDEIAKLIPPDVVEAAAMQLPGMAGHQRYVREAIAAALAVWPRALCAPPDSWTRHKRDAGSIILPLKEPRT
jgi:hypothetical protein